MRQVFTSPRLENVERVAALLQEHGVVTRITNGRTFKGSLRGSFSYRESANKNPPPAVWVVRSEDQPKARELLREAGLLDSGRSPTSYLSTDLLHSARDDANDPARRRMFRIKAGLLISITIAISLGLFSWLKSTSKAPAASVSVASAPAPQAAMAETMMLPSDATQSAYVAAVPSALAAMLATAELRAREGADMCLSVDGADPSETVLAQFEAGDRARIRSRSACGTAADAASALSIDVREYRTDGSGSGTVQLEIAKAKDGQAQAQAESRTLEVRRDGLEWEVKRVVPDTP